MLRLTHTAIPKMTTYLPMTTFRKRRYPLLLITACMQELDHVGRDGLELHGLSQVRGAEAEAEAEAVAVVGVVED